MTTWSDRVFGGSDPFGFGDLKNRTWFRPLCKWLIVTEAIGFLISGAYVLHAIASGSSWPAGIVFFVPAFPLLFAGQLTAIVCLFGERRQGTRTRRRIAWDFVTHRDVRVYALQVALLATFYLAAIQGMSAGNGPFSEGNPVGPTPTCPWPLENHGAITCVSHSTYIAAVTESQRFVGGVILGFFAFQLAILIGFMANRSISPATR